MGNNDMDHLKYIEAVVLSDAAVLREKEATYQGSWKRAGGRSAWFMARRNMDRLLVMLAPPKDEIQFSLADLDDAIAQAKESDTGDCTVDFSVMEYLRDSFVAEDIFAKIEEHPNGEDGTVLACVRDLRRYFALVEAEMISRGDVKPEREMPAARRLSECAVSVRPGDTLTIENEGNREEVFVYDKDSRLKFGITLAEEKKIDLGLDGPVAQEFFRTPLEQKTIHHHVPATEVEHTTKRRVGDIEKTDTTIERTFHTPDKAHIGSLVMHETARPDIYGYKDGKMDVERQQRTPEDGAQHATLHPWAICSLMYVRMSQRTESASDAFYTRRAAELFVLEAYVTSHNLPLELRDVYILIPGGHWIININKCPADARQFYPVLRSELNSKEHEDLPPWQRPLYQWNETPSKWILMAIHEGWSEE